MTGEKSLTHEPLHRAVFSLMRFLPELFTFEKNTMENEHVKLSNKSGDHLGWIEMVRQQVASVDFGAVQIIIHDSRVVQIETTERLRFNNSADAHRVAESK